MKLALSRRDLHPVLAVVQRIVERRAHVPILSNVLLSADARGLTLRATDLDIEISTRIAAEVEEPGSITVPAARLHDIVGKLADGQIRLEAAGDSASEVRLVSGRARFALQALPATDYPALESGELPHAFGLPADLLAAALEGVALAISTEETRYYLNGVYVHVSGDTGLLTFVATDGHRLSLVRRDCPNGADAMPGVIVPRKTVAEVIKLCRGNPKEAHLSVSDAKIRFEIGDVTLVSKLIDGTFPEYGRVIPAPPPITAVVPREAMRDAVDRVTTVSSERGRAVKLTIEEAASEMRLEVFNADAGSAIETVDMAAPASGSIEIGLNGQYLAGAVDALSGDTVSIAATDPGSPVLMTPADDRSGSRRLIVVMPMRV